MDEHRRYDFAVKLIGALCTGYHCSAWQALVVPEQVLDQKRLAGFALADQHHHLVVFNLCHVELPELEIQSSLWARL